MDELKLSLIFDRLKDRYPLRLASSLELNEEFSAGFYQYDFPVLTGQSCLGRFFLYDDGNAYILDYNTAEGIAARHWHPADTEEALQLVIAFMDGTLR